MVYFSYKLDLIYYVIHIPTVSIICMNKYSTMSLIHITNLKNLLSTIQFRVVVYLNLRHASLSVLYRSVNSYGLPAMNKWQYEHNDISPNHRLNILWNIQIRKSHDMYILKIYIYLSWCIKLNKTVYLSYTPLCHNILTTASRYSSRKHILPNMCN